MNRKMKDQREIDWEQRRYELAKAVFPTLISGILSDIKILQEKGVIDYETRIAIMGEGNANEAVSFADVLIEELKKE